MMVLGGKMFKVGDKVKITGTNGLFVSNLKSTKGSTGTITHIRNSSIFPFEVTMDDQPVTTFGYDKVRALLAYLAVASQRPHRRESLAGLLWPEQP